MYWSFLDMIYQIILLFIHSDSLELRIAKQDLCPFLMRIRRRAAS